MSLLSWEPKQLQLSGIGLLPKMRDRLRGGWVKRVCSCGDRGIRYQSMSRSTHNHEFKIGCRVCVGTGTC